MAKLDHGAAERLIRRHLQNNLAALPGDGLGPPSFVGPDQPQPPRPWSRHALVHLVACDVTPRARQRPLAGTGPTAGLPDHADAADVTIVVSLEVDHPAQDANVYALSAWLAALARHLDEAVVEEPATDHRLTLARAAAAADRPDRDQPRVRSGVVTVTGELVRGSGSGLTPIPVIA